MKKSSLVIVLLIVVALSLVLASCGPESTSTIQIVANNTLPYTFNVGDSVDFTQYFTISTSFGINIPVKQNMLDLSNVDLQHAGTFDVTLTFREKTLTLTFTVVDDGQGGQGGQGGDEIEVLQAILNKYKDSANWNFVVGMLMPTDNYQESYSYYGDSVSNTYEGFDFLTGESLGMFTDYLEYDAVNDAYCYYSDNGDDTYTKYTQDADDFATLVSYLYLLDLSTICDYAFDEMENYYLAKDPASLGADLFGETVEPFTDISVYVDDEHIVKLLLEMGSESIEFTFSGYNTVEIDFSTLTVSEVVDGGNTQPDDPVENPQAFVELLSQYDNYADWNFSVRFSQTYEGETYTEDYDYLGYDIKYSYTYDADSYVEYLTLGDDELYYYYIDNGDGTYEIIDENSDYFWMYYADMMIFEPSILSYYEFEEVGGNFVAVDPNTAGIGIFGDYGEEDGTVWVSVVITVVDGKIAKLEGVMDDDFTIAYTFSNYGHVNFALPDENGNQGGGENPTPSNTSVFTNAQLGVGAGQLAYTTSAKPHGFSADYGVQFLQEDGVVTVVSAQSVDNVTAVTVAVKTNQDAGMYVSVKVGGVVLTSGGEENLFVAKSSDLVSVTFTTDSALSGKVSVTLTPTADKKSMYLSSISLTVDENGGNQGGETVDLATIFALYNDYAKWNFVTTMTLSQGGESVCEIHEYLGANMSQTYEDEDGNILTDYWYYDVDEQTWYLFADNGDGTYTKYVEDSEEFDEAYYAFYFLELTSLARYSFVESGDHFEASNPSSAGNTILGDFGMAWTSVWIYVENGKISNITATLTGGYEFSYDFSDYGTVNFDDAPFNSENGGNQGGEQGTTFADGTYKSTFATKQLGVGEGELKYTANLSATSFTPPRGLQFAQSNGPVHVTSVLTLNGVSGVAVIVQTNSDTGMYVSVKVGGVELTCGGETSVFVSKASGYTNLETIEFVSSTALNGQVVVTLTPSGSKNSMYLNSIAVTIGKGGESGTMPTQNYNPSTFDSENLQDKNLNEQGAIGLPSTGTYNALVIPVQFVGDTITQAQLDNLEIAFNGTAAQTGWESVSSYYQKSSFGALNITFDIQPVYNASYNSNYYKNYEKTVSTSSYVYTQYGYDLLLTEVLSYYEHLLDLTEYDSNNDGCIDAVYLIYSAPVDYYNADFYWAYVTWYYGEDQWDGLDAYYFLFAGIDFMYDDVDGNQYAYTGGIDGLNVNASTYIHETGHLLGLDDYYDYEENKGCNEGLGGADIMADATAGDHNAYSKIMLGWVTPTIVTQTTTITIESAVSSGDCILIPLDFNNSYFGEYLLIDLYTATGLNQLDASQPRSYLFAGESYGVRIYHVSASANNPYENSYGTYTDYNNSDTKFALIKLVEADGEKKFVSDDGWANWDDLWQAGDVFSHVYATYTRNDGKVVNFDITINAVSQTEASITITFYE